MASPPRVSDVLASTVRTAILRDLGSGGTTKAALCDRIDASDAAVYKEINRLIDDGFVEGIDEEWTLTGRGAIVLSILELHERADRLFERDLEDEYWRTHDPSIVPVAFQATFNLLADCEMVRASERDTAMWRVAEAIDAADRVDVVAIVYDFEVGLALDRAIDRGVPIRILADATLVDEVLRIRSNFSWDPADVEVRVAEVGFALGVTDVEVALSLPFLDGGFDLQTVLVSDDPLAQTWGELLFGCFWREATPVEEYLPAGETLRVFEDNSDSGPDTDSAAERRAG